MLPNYIKSFFQSKNKILLTCLILFITALVIAAVFTGQILSRETYYKGVIVEGIDLEGLSREEGLKRVEDYVRNTYTGRILTFRYFDKYWQLELKEIDFNIPVQDVLNQAYDLGRKGNTFNRIAGIIKMRRNSIYLDSKPEFDYQKLAEFLAEIKEQIDGPCKNAYVVFKNERVTVEREVMGNNFHIEENMKIIDSKLKERNLDSIDIIVEEIKPDFVYNDLKDINGVLASTTTKYNVNDKNRSSNIKLASGKINGLLIKPGEVFSMNESLGSRTAENGYKDAKVIFNNRLIEGIGGGVCQVSSTLYGSVVKSKIEVTERVKHSMVLTYVDPGQDATIAENQIDFKFKNNLDSVIAISAEAENGYLSIRILGKREDDGRKARLVSEIVNVYPPEKEELIIDNSIPQGQKISVRKPHNGMRVNVYREVLDSSEKVLERQKVSEEYYSPIKGLSKVNENYKNQIYNGADDNSEENNEGNIDESIPYEEAFNLL